MDFLIKATIENKRYFMKITNLPGFSKNQVPLSKHMYGSVFLIVFFLLLFKKIMSKVNNIKTNTTSSLIFPLALASFCFSLCCL